MSVDAYTRGVLSIIALALSLLAARAWLEPAWAQSMECRVSGPIAISDLPDVDVRLLSWPGALETRPYSSSVPGSWLQASSSSSPSCSGPVRR